MSLFANVLFVYIAFPFGCGLADTLTESYKFCKEKDRNSNNITKLHRDLCKCNEIKYPLEFLSPHFKHQARRSDTIMIFFFFFSFWMERVSQTARYGICKPELFSSQSINVSDKACAKQHHPPRWCRQINLRAIQSLQWRYASCHGISFP